MQHDPELGFELPLKILVYKDNLQSTWITYPNTRFFEKNYLIRNKKVLEKVRMTIDEIITRAVKAENE